MNDRVLEMKLDTLRRLLKIYGDERLKNIPTYRELIKLRDEMEKEPTNSKSYRRWQKRRRKNRKKKERMK